MEYLMAKGWTWLMQPTLGAVSALGAPGVKNIEEQRCEHCISPENTEHHRSRANRSEPGGVTLLLKQCFQLGWSSCSSQELSVLWSGLTMRIKLITR